MDTLEQYVEDIMKEAGTWDMDPALRAPLVQNLVVQVERRLGLAAVAALGENDMEAFDQFMGQKPTPSSDKVIEFVQGRIEDFESLMASALMEFRNEFVEGAKRLMAEAHAQG